RAAEATHRYFPAFASSLPIARVEAQGIAYPLSGAHPESARMSPSARSPLPSSDESGAPATRSARSALRRAAARETPPPESSAHEGRGCPGKAAARGLPCMLQRETLVQIHAALRDNWGDLGVARQSDAVPRASSPRKRGSRASDESVAGFPLSRE